MIFRNPTLEQNAVDELVRCPVHSIEPYTLMVAPTYVLLKKNEKLISVKAPLDFFTPEELKKLELYEYFYFSKFIQEFSPYQTSGKIVKGLLSIDPLKGDLPPAAFQITKELTSLVAPLWGAGRAIDPFFAAVFTDELCEGISPKLLMQVRDASVENHDRGIQLSGLVIFLGVLLGWHSIEFLKSLRSQVYESAHTGIPHQDWSGPVKTVIQSAGKELDRGGLISFDQLARSPEEWARRLTARLRSFEERKLLGQEDSPTIRSSEGFAA